jgi:isopentenyl-diphosphate delta-isomerase
MNNYYKQKQMIARVDKNGKIIGQIDKWEAHEKGILHKALSVALIYKGQFVLQERKHPAFDKVLDLTSSSHQLYIVGKLQTSLEATMDCLLREWGITIDDLVSTPKKLGAIYYKAKDPNSIYIEHEVCDILEAEIISEPNPNLDFAYGFKLINKEELIDTKSEIYKKLAPWSQVAINKGFI